MSTALSNGVLIIIHCIGFTSIVQKSVKSGTGIDRFQTGPVNAIKKAPKSNVQQTSGYDAHDCWCVKNRTFSPQAASYFFLDMLVPIFMILYSSIQVLIISGNSRVLSSTMRKKSNDSQRLHGLIEFNTKPKFVNKPNQVNSKFWPWT